MNVIYKYVFDPVEFQTLQTKRIVKILSVQMQGQLMCLWAMVDEASSEEALKIHVCGTGMYPSENYDIFLGTVQQGTLVFHVFTKKEFHHSF